MIAKTAPYILKPPCRSVTWHGFYANSYK